VHVVGDKVSCDQGGLCALPTALHVPCSADNSLLGQLSTPGPDNSLSSYLYHVILKLWGRRISLARYSKTEVPGDFIYLRRRISLT